MGAFFDTYGGYIVGGAVALVLFASFYFGGRKVAMLRTKPKEVQWVVPVPLKPKEEEPVEPQS